MSAATGGSRHGLQCGWHELQWQVVGPIMIPFSGWIISKLFPAKDTQ
jgi:hypothetical protein